MRTLALRQVALTAPLPPSSKEGANRALTMMHELFALCAHRCPRATPSVHMAKNCPKEAEVAGARARVLIDSGAELNHISSEFCKRHGIILQK
eukprot:IDg3823t1